MAMAPRLNDHVHVWRAPVAALLLIAAVAALAGCGDDEPARIRSALSAGLTSQNPRVVCEGSLSPALLMRIYGGTAKCHQTEGAPAERISQAQSVEVPDVRVHDRDATAVVVIHGGNHDGARGRLSLHRTAGHWLVRDLSVALLRSQFEAGIRRMQSIDPMLKTCVVLKMRKLADPAFKRLAFDAGSAAHAWLESAAKRCQALIAATQRVVV